MVDVISVYDAAAQIVSQLAPMFMIMIGLLLGLMAVRYTISVIRYFADEPRFDEQRFAAAFPEPTKPDPYVMSEVKTAPTQVKPRGWICRFCGTKDCEGSACPNCGAPRPDEYDKEFGYEAYSKNGGG